MGQVTFEVDLSKVTTNDDGSVTIGDSNVTGTIDGSFFAELLAKEADGIVITDVVEFAEKILGVELLEYQKFLLRRFAELPKDSKVVADHLGQWRVISTKSEEKENGTNK